ncbi:hypothetical protein ACLOJK_020583 [Asimina triloba]
MKMNLVGNYWTQYIKLIRPKKWKMANLSPPNHPRQPVFDEASIKVRMSQKTPDLLDGGAQELVHHRSTGIGAPSPTSATTTTAGGRSEPDNVTVTTRRPPIRRGRTPTMTTAISITRSIPPIAGK